MATIDELRARAELIAEENQIGGNTAERVGEAFDMVADIIEAVAPGDEQAVLYNPQSPNEAQKAQARANIGAQETISDIADFVKVSAQTFTAAQKQQARENIGAEQAGGAVKNLAGSASDTETYIKAANNPNLQANIHLSGNIIYVNGIAGGIDLDNNGVNIKAGNSGYPNAKVKVNGEEVATKLYVDGKVDDRATSIEDALALIEAVIPSQASAQNQLADKAFVNSSISSSTANFVGTFDSLAELQAVTGATNNDYGFVIETDAQGNQYYDRYKYNGTSWIFEYKVESTAFTAAQWAAIQSGITSALVSKLSALPTNAELTTSLDAKADKTDTYTKAQVDAAIAAIDVSSQIAVKADKVANAVAGDFAGLDANGNLVDSGKKASDFATAAQGAKADAAAPQSTTYTKTEVNNLIVPASTTIQVVTALPATGSANTIYRVAGTNSYTDYGWDGTQFVPLATYNGDLSSIVGYYECSSAAWSHKYIDIPEFALSTHLLFFVKFLQYNSNSNPLLYINYSNAHSIIYNGEAVSPTNTWGGGEVVMIYYDGSNYVATPLSEYTDKKQGLLMNGVFDWEMPQLDTRSRVSLYAYKGQRTTFKLTLPNTLSAYCALEVRKVKDGVITTVATSGVSVAAGSLTNSKLFVFPESAMYFIDVYTTAYAQLSGNVSISITTEDNIADYFINEERLSALEACLDLHRSDGITLVNYPASSTGGNTSSGAFKGYEVDLTSIRATYKYIYFRGSNSSTSNNVVRGVTINDSDVVENYTQTTESYSNGWQSLPITSVSKKFRGTYCILSDYGETWYPTIVYFAKESTNIAEITERLDELSEQIGERFPSTYLPATTYAVVGDTLQLFNRGVTISQNPSRWYNNFTCNIGKVYSRYLELTPTNAGSSYTIAHRLIDDHYNYSTQKNTSLSIAAKPTTSPSSNINVLCVGASTTEGGEWASELKRRLTGSGGSPEANGLSNITFVGRKSLESSARRPMAINVEATGGWTWRSFYTPADALRFVVSGVSAVNIGDVYQFSNASGIVKIQAAEVNVTGSSGNIRFLYNWNTEARGLPTSQSGTLTKVSGSGDNQIAYTSATEENYAPFYDEGTGNPDFTGYADTYCNGQIDAVIFNMGTINEGIMGDDSLTTLLANMKTLLDALHADFPSCKVILCNGGGFNQYHGVEYNYGAASRYTQWGAMYGQFRYAEALNEFIASNNYRDWCFIANTIGETDSEHIFPTTQKAVNTRVTDMTETIGTNGAHPTLAGYQMIADCVYRCFVNVIL